MTQFRIKWATIEGEWDKLRRDRQRHPPHGEWDRYGGPLDSSLIGILQFCIDDHCMYDEIIETSGLAVEGKSHRRVQGRHFALVPFAVRIAAILATKELDVVPIGQGVRFADRESVAEFWFIKQYNNIDLVDDRKGDRDPIHLLVPIREFHTEADRFLRELRQAIADREPDALDWQSLMPLALYPWDHDK